MLYSVSQLNGLFPDSERILCENSSISRTSPFPQNTKLMGDKRSGLSEISCCGWESDGLIRKLAVFVSISNRFGEHFRDKSTIHQSHLQSSHNGTIRTILRSCYFLKRRARLLQSYQYQTHRRRVRASRIGRVDLQTAVS
jgi:hypothetical protein